MKIQESAARHIQTCILCLCLLKFTSIYRQSFIEIHQLFDLRCPQTASPYTVSNTSTGFASFKCYSLVYTVLLLHLYNECLLKRAGRNFLEQLFYMLCHKIVGTTPGWL